MDINRKEAGHTLLELLFVLVIMAILMMLVSSAWTPLKERVQASAVQSNIQRAFTLARSHAVHSRTVVTLCPLASNQHCTNDWSQPVGIFLDSRSFQAVQEESKLLKLLELSSSGVLRPSNAGSGPRRYFQFNPDGSSRGSIGHLTWCPPSLNPERANHVLINFGGRLRWSRDTDNDGIVEDANGNNISC